MCDVLDLSQLQPGGFGQLPRLPHRVLDCFRARFIHGLLRIGQAELHPADIGRPLIEHLAHERAEPRQVGKPHSNAVDGGVGVLLP